VRAIRGLLRRLVAHRAAPVFALVPCALATAVGFYLLLGFNGTAAPQHSAPAVWPAASEIALHPGKPAVLVFLHPLCPCSRATLHELDRVLSLLFPAAPHPDIHLLFVRSAQTPEWNGGDLWRDATGVRGAVSQWDEGGREAARFRALTSGAVLLYGAHGNLLFQGGITGARGHEGDNLGASHLLAALETGRRAGPLSQVFGCALAIDKAPGGGR
jgi:hypothetical protein